MSYMQCPLYDIGPNISLIYLHPCSVFSYQLKVIIIIIIIIIVIIIIIIFIIIIIIASFYYSIIYV